MSALFTSILLFVTPFEYATMKAIERIRNRGGSLMLCCLMLFLLGPLSAQAQEPPSVPDIPSTRVTKNGTVIEEGAPPATRRPRTPEPRDKDVRERPPKASRNHDIAPPAAIDRPAVPEASTDPLSVSAPEVESKAIASKASASTVPTPIVAATERDSPVFEIGLDGRRPAWLQEGLFAATLEAPSVAEAPELPASTALLLQRKAEAAQAVVGATETMDIPAAFALEANYPNPFNPETTIRFALPEASHVRIQVYDLLGRVVAHLVDGDLAAGRHEVVFEARGLSSGIYMYRMDAGSFKQHRTMLLMK